MNILAKLKLDRHHLIERFGVIFMALLVMISSLSIVIALEDRQRQKDAFRDAYLYTSSFSSSLTDSSGSVVNLYVNSERTKAFLLLKFSSTSSISLDVNTYQLMLSGSDINGNYEALKCSPTASIYILGSTGYFGIYLSDDNGFSNQIMRLIVRMNRRLSGSVTSSGAVTIEQTFAEHDQFQIYFNPCGEAAPGADFFDENGITSVGDVYYLAALRNSEISARNALVSHLHKMEQAFLRIKEYEARLFIAGIELPERPVQIRGDYIEAQFNGQIVEMTDNENYVYPEGHAKAGNIIPDSELVRYLRTDNVPPGGYEYDWYNGSVQDGYLSSLVGDMTVREYLNHMSTLRNSSKINMTVSDIQWKYTDGTDFKYNSAVDPQSIADINSNIQSLIDAWKSYLSMRVEYQTSLMEELLLIERDYREISDTYTVNDDPSNLWCY